MLLLCGGPYYSIVFFIWQYRIFPRYDNIHHRKIILWRDSILVSLVAGITILLLAIAPRDHDEKDVFLLMLCLFMIQLVVLLPLAWWLYTNRQTRTATMLNLEKALGRSTADLDFLRS